MTKSPFLINQRVFPAKICQELADKALPLAGDGSFREELDGDTVSKFAQYVAGLIESYYDTEIIKSTPVLDSFSTTHIPEIKCESTVHQNGKWFRNKDYDFETVVFLKDHLATPPIDTAFEVYGGKLEFPTFNFGFMPERGTAVTFPCIPNFINSTAKVQIGQLDVLRIFHRSATMFNYEASRFAGDPSVWFRDLV